MLKIKCVFFVIVYIGRKTCLLLSFVCAHVLSEWDSYCKGLWETLSSSYVKVHKNHIHHSSGSHQQWHNVTVSPHSNAFFHISMLFMAHMEMRNRHSPTLMSLCATASQGHMPYLTDVWYVCLNVKHKCHDEVELLTVSHCWSSQKATFSPGCNSNIRLESKLQWSRQINFWRLN